MKIYTLGVDPEDMDPYPYYGNRTMQSERYGYSFNNLKLFLKSS